MTNSLLETAQETRTWYQLQRGEGSGYGLGDTVEDFELTRDEYIEFKRHLAKMRGLSPDGESPKRAPNCQYGLDEINRLHNILRGAWEIAWLENQPEGRRIGSDRLFKNVTEQLGIAMDLAEMMK